MSIPMRRRPDKRGKPLSKALQRAQPSAPQPPTLQAIYDRSGEVQALFADKSAMAGELQGTLGKLLALTLPEPIAAHDAMQGWIALQNLEADGARLWQQYLGELLMFVAWAREFPA